MKKLLDLSMITLPWLMLIMFTLSVLTMLVVLYQKKRLHQQIKSKG